MNDYDADPLWDATSGVMVSLDDLPLSHETRTTVRLGPAMGRVGQPGPGRGLRRYTELAHRAVPAELWGEHERDGSATWRVLRRELGASWRVGWVSFPTDGATFSGSRMARSS
jgi:hypothetical protein